MTERSTPESSRQKPNTVRSTLDIIRYHDIIDEILNNPEVNDKINWTGGTDDN